MEKSRGVRVEGLGFGLLHSGELRTSSKEGASGMNVVVAWETRRRARVRWKRRGKYTGVGMRRRAPVVICTRG